MERAAEGGHARARWRKVRAATLVFVLFRRCARHHAPHQPRRAPTSVFFAKQSVHAAAASAAQRLATAPSTAASPQVAQWFDQKLRMFDRLVHKPIQNRTDIDVKILAEFIRHTKFFQGLTSASVDALAQHLIFRTCHEGEILHRQGDTIGDTCGRYIVVNGSLMVYKNAQYALHAREGEDYIEWFLASNSGVTHDSIRYGDCIDTCTSGDTTGDDATLGHLFREHTVVAQVKTVIAYIIRADYKNAVRYNIENECQVLAAVREILTPPKLSKNDVRQSWAGKDGATHSTPYVPPQGHISPQQARVLMRFLGRYKCFRILPYQFCMELIPKLQLCVVKSGEVCCTSREDKPSMIMVLDGKLCVHVNESHEAQALLARDCCGVDARAIKSPNSVKTQYFPGCEAGSAVDLAVSSSSLHISSLTGGESFGELVLSCSDYALQGASIYHPFTPTGQTSATLVRLYRHDYEAVVQRYIESAHCNFESVCTILSQSLPQDRTDEQVHYIKTFLLYHSSARLFFTQIPSRILDSLFLHALLERYDINDEIEGFIQREDDHVHFMRIVLKGYVGVFKGGALTSTFSHPKEESMPLAPKKAVLRRFQSRLIRANTHILDTNKGKPAGRRASLVRNLPAISRPGLPDLSEDMKPEMTMIDPVSILPCGAAFGHLQVLTGRSKSPYTYAAYASSPATLDETRVDEKPSVCLLCIPAPFVLLYLASLDGEVVYNPTRALKRLQHESFTLARSGAPASSLIRQLHLPSLFCFSPTFRGLPYAISASMIETMSIVSVDSHRLLYGLGDAVHRLLLVVLSGSVRVFSYASKVKTRDRRGSFLQASEDKRPKLPRRISQETSEMKAEESMTTDPTAVHYSFEKPAGDSVFLSDYSQTQELASGDCFGRHEFHSLVWCNSRRPSNNTLSRRQSRLHATYSENAVSMSECLIGVVTRRQHPCELSTNERAQLLRMVDDREDRVCSKAEPSSGEAPMIPQFNSLSSSFVVLEAMGLANRLTTHQRVQAASSLKHWRLRPRECVFRQGEESEAIYYVLFGRVALFVKNTSDHHSDQRLKGLVPEDGHHFLDVLEGEVFGEEVFRDVHGSLRNCTAAAAMEDSQDVDLLFLTRQDIDRLSNVNVPSHAAVRDGDNDATLQLLGLVQRSVSAKQRWKMAIYQVIQLRAQRSNWPPVLTKARNHRIDLLLELVKELPAFEGAPVSTIKGFCCNAVLQTYGVDAIVYNKGDSLVDVCFLVVQGAVTLYQTHYGNATPALVATSTPGGCVLSAESTSTRVPICTIRAGGIFGEFEILEEHARRHISAVVLQPGTKVVVIQCADYLSFWPRREQMERKLILLKSQLQKLCRLDSDQLCSLYHGTEEKVFRRNEVIMGSKEQADYLHLIQEGICVVRDIVTLKRKKGSTGSGGTKDTPLQLSLDTGVSTLDPGVILVAEQIDMTLPTEARRALSRTLDTAEHEAPRESKPTQYVVVDSPAVTTLSVKLFPKRQLGTQRQSDLLAMFLLGKSGLRVIRETMQSQIRWRADNVAQTSRLVANALSQPRKQKAGLVGSITNGAMSTQCARLVKARNPDVPNALLCQARDLDTNAASLNESPRKHVPVISPTTSPSTSLRSVTIATFGSFNVLQSDRAKQTTCRSNLSDSPRLPTLPILSSVSSPQSGSAPLTPRPPQTGAQLNRLDQLRSEECVLMSARATQTREKISQKVLAYQMRTRHGRPPARCVEASNLFINERAVTSVANLRDEHERKKTGLCRRLLHVKGAI